VALSASTARHPFYRAARAVLGALTVVITGWYIWTVAFAQTRFWEGSRPRLHGIDEWAPLTDPAGWRWDGPAALIGADGDRAVRIVFNGAGCTRSPWRVSAAYAPEVVVIDIDPDPRGCRGGNGEMGETRHGAELRLREPIAGRVVEVRCRGSSRCDPSWPRGA
jgi:hypothetical protein